MPTKRTDAAKPAPASTEATPGGVAKVGRRFSRARAVADGLTGVVPDDVLSLDKWQRFCTDYLEACGLPTAEFLGADDSGSSLRRHVVETLAHDVDSPIGLAGRIVELCIRLRAYLAHGATPQVVAGESFRLGRFATLLRVYHADDMQAAIRRRRAKAAAAAPRPEGRKVDHDEVKAEFHRLCRQGHTPSEARGILAARGMASHTTIWRLTKDLQ